MSKFLAAAAVLTFGGFGTLKAQQSDTTAYTIDQSLQSKRNFVTAQMVDDDAARLAFFSLCSGNPRTIDRSHCLFVDIYDANKNRIIGDKGDIWISAAFNPIANDTDHRILLDLLQNKEHMYYDASKEMDEEEFKVACAEFNKQNYTQEKATQEIWDKFEILVLQL